MTIRSKILLAFLLITAVAVISTGGAAYRQARQALEKATFERLTALRETKSRQIEGYFQLLQTQVSTTAQLPFVAEALEEFSAAFECWALEDPAHRAAGIKQVRAYYETEFGPRFQRGSGRPLPVEDLLPSDERTLLLQYHYIAANDHPTGQKDRLAQAGDGSQYSRVHARYHEVFRRLLHAYGFYDLFLIERHTGHIVYSVFKEIDVGTSLLGGPFKDTNLAIAFRAARDSADPNAATLVDFEPYVPSYAAPAAFIAAPVQLAGGGAGVLACQVPIDRINEVMTSGRNWRSDGLGQSGETYLVGSDYLMRSDSRFIAEDPDAFFGQLAALGLPSAEIEPMKRHKTTVLFQRVKSAATTAALSGIRNTQIITDYRGVAVLSSFAPLDIPGVSWAILSEIDEREAFAAAESLKAQSLRLGILIMVLFGLAALLFSRTITQPLRRLIERFTDIAQGQGDLTRRVDQERRDELGTLGKWFNTFVGQVHEIVKAVTSSTLEVTSAATQMAASARQQEQTVRHHQQTTDEVAKAVSQIARTISELTLTMNEINQVAQRTGHSASSGELRLQDLDKSMGALNEATATMNDNIASFQDTTAKINLITNTMIKVVDQTNLLSVNACLEAEKAGDHGPGFRVVAGEMRRLADQTAEATLEIEKIVTAMSQSLSTTVGEMTAYGQQVQTGVQQVQLVHRDLGQVISDVAHLTQRFTEINQLMKAQSGEVGQINESVGHLNSSASQISNSIAEFTQVTAQLQTVVSQLRGHVSVFKIEAAR